MTGAFVRLSESTGKTGPAEECFPYTLTVNNDYDQDSRKVKCSDSQDNRQNFTVCGP
ncbi:MAG TPA: hypothetical protein VKA87_07635 [Nitrososphaeraceae archaeon]|nr:hypothetical protein [Nitrososphaeraceae archaeon]